MRESVLKALDDIVLEKCLAFDEPGEAERHTASVSNENTIA
jgi:hypothetical protein